MIFPGREKVSLPRQRRFFAPYQASLEPPPSIIMGADSYLASRKLEYLRLNHRVRIPTTNTEHYWGERITTSPPPMARPPACIRPGPPSPELLDSYTVVTQTNVVDVNLVAVDVYIKQAALSLNSSKLFVCEGLRKRGDGDHCVQPAGIACSDARREHLLRSCC